MGIIQTLMSNFYMIYHTNSCPCPQRQLPTRGYGIWAKDSSTRNWQNVSKEYTQISPQKAQSLLRNEIPIISDRWTYPAICIRFSRAKSHSWWMGWMVEDYADRVMGSIWRVLLPMAIDTKPAHMANTARSVAKQAAQKMIAGSSTPGWMGWMGWIVIDWTSV